MSEAAIEASGLSVHFRRALFRSPIRALDGFDLRVERGDVFGLLGPNGAGKSTAMYCFLGLIRPRAGSVAVLGERPVPGAPLFDRVAYLPEEPHYHLYLTVEQAVRYYAALYRREIPEAKIRGALERVGLDEFRDLRLEKCSKGMKQKAGIAACVAADPELLFMDEPTRGLDPIVVREVRDILLEMSRSGTTVIVNSHVLSEVEMVCNRVAIMNKGKVVACDSISRLLTIDRERYLLRIDPTEAALPEYVHVTDRSRDGIRGSIPADRVEDLFRFAREAGVRVEEVAFRKNTLEDAFLEILGKEGES